MPGCSKRKKEKRKQELVPNWRELQKTRDKSITGETRGACRRMEIGVSFKGG